MLFLLQLTHPHAACPAAEPLIPLPALTHSNTPSTTISGSTAADTSEPNTSTTSSSGSSSGLQRQRVLHVFWDVSSLHPGGHDPRVVLAQLRRVLGCYGRVEGIVAFGIQKLFNWVPEAFMLQYAPERLPGEVLGVQGWAIKVLTAACYQW